VPYACRGGSHSAPSRLFIGQVFALNFRFKLMADDVKIVILEHT
jgi:hypothetical protein